MTNIDIRHALFEADRQLAAQLFDRAANWNYTPSTDDDDLILVAGRDGILVGALTDEPTPGRSPNSRSTNMYTPDAHGSSSSPSNPQHEAEVWGEHSYTSSLQKVEIADVPTSASLSPKTTD